MQKHEHIHLNTTVKR